MFVYDISTGILANFRLLVNIEYKFISYMTKTPVKGVYIANTGSRIFFTGFDNPSTVKNSRMAQTLESASDPRTYQRVISGTRNEEAGQTSYPQNACADCQNTKIKSPPNKPNLKSPLLPVSPKAPQTIGPKAPPVLIPILTNVTRI